MEIIASGYVDVSLIDSASAKIIGYDWYELLKDFYSNPENEKAFHEYLKEKYGEEVLHDTHFL